MSAYESRPSEAEAASEASGPAIDFTGVQKVWEDFLNGTIPVLPGIIADVWRDGYWAAVERLRPRIEAAERDAESWYFKANNPLEAVDEAKRTLALIQTAQGREADTRRRKALDLLQASDPVEYARVSYLGLTDRAAYLQALKPWEVAS